MAEVAGTIVGVISLSLQLYDKLSEYTNGVKDAKKKAEQITRELDTLVDLLEYLETATSRMDPTTPIALVKAIIQQCALSIESIRAKVGDDTPSMGSSKFSTQSRKVIRRLAYPFKESDIKYWRDALSSVRQNLQIALQALEMDQWQQNFATVQGQLGQLSLNTQMILDQQRRAQTSPSRYFIDQSRRLSAELATSHRDLGSIQPFVGQHVHLSAKDHPIGVDSPSSSATWRQNCLSDALLPMSAVSLEQETTHLQRLERRTQHMRSRRSKKSHTSKSCTCREYHLKKQFVQSPFVVSVNVSHFHDPSCRLWFAGDHTTTFSFGMVLCYLIFGLKLRLFMELSVGSGTFSIVPSLLCRRVVTNSSPAFRLIYSMFQSSSSTKRNSKNSMKLTRMFQRREASPHDRLVDGSTLLHALCAALSPIDEYVTQGDAEVFRSVLKQLLSYMTYADASDTDDSGRTCIDVLCFDPCHSRSDDLALESVILDLLRHDLKISWAVKVYGGETFLAELPFTEFPDPFVGLSGATVAALSRSEVELSNAIQGRQHCDKLPKKEARNLYELTTRMGWVPGCQTLLDVGVLYISDKPLSTPLLLTAIDSRNEAILRFWLDIRKSASARCCTDIGSLEHAVVYALKQHEVDLAGIVTTHLVEQRQQLRQMTATSGIHCECIWKSEGLLDAHATCALRALDEHNFSVPPSIRPSERCVYTISLIHSMSSHVCVTSGRMDTSNILQFLYDTGFKDLAKEHIEGCQNVYYLPLHFAIERYTGDFPNQLSGMFEIIYWFVGKGASIFDCWPGSKATTMHCINTKAAIMTSGMWLGFRRWPDDSWNKIVPMLQYTLTDDCECNCSTQGCTGITSFLNSVALSSNGTKNILTMMSPGFIFRCRHRRREFRRLFVRIVQLVTTASEDAKHRWIITQFIRLCAFAWLGIRHTCCNLYEFVNRRWPPYFSHQPPSRCPPEELERVQEEDATLVSLLEDLVPRFDLRYDTHEGGLQSFVDNVLRPEMKVVLNRLKQEDEAAHAAGRREMGVIMIDERKSDVNGGYGSDSNEESESESDDESEGDSLEDYGTDSLDEYESDAHEDD